MLRREGWKETAPRNLINWATRGLLGSAGSRATERMAEVLRNGTWVPLQDSFDATLHLRVEMVELLQNDMQVEHKPVKPIERERKQTHENEIDHELAR